MKTTVIFFIMLNTFLIDMSISLTDESKIYANCKLNQYNNSGVSGYVKFSQDKVGSDYVFISVDIEKVPLNSARKNGLHIHENPISGNDCESAGGHFNPYNKEHGGPNDEIRHVGDLGNISINSDGHAMFEISDNNISLKNSTSSYIIGKSCVLHSLEDDFGKGTPEEESKKSGNSGSRIACGTIVESESKTVLNIGFSLVLVIVIMLVNLS